MDIEDIIRQTLDPRGKLTAEDYQDRYQDFFLHTMQRDEFHKSLAAQGLELHKMQKWPTAKTRAAIEPFAVQWAKSNPVKYGDEEARDNHSVSSVVEKSARPKSGISINGVSLSDIDPRLMLDKDSKQLLIMMQQGKLPERHMEDAKKLITISMTKAAEAIKEARDIKAILPDKLTSNFARKLSDEEVGQVLDAESGYGIDQRNSEDRESRKEREKRIEAAGGRSTLEGYLIAMNQERLFNTVGIGGDGNIDDVYTKGSRLEGLALHPDDVDEDTGEDAYYKRFPGDTAEFNREVAIDAVYQATKDSFYTIDEGKRIAWLTEQFNRRSQYGPQNEYQSPEQFEWSGLTAFQRSDGQHQLFISGKGIEQRFGMVLSDENLKQLSDAMREDILTAYDNAVHSQPTRRLRMCLEHGTMKAQYGASQGNRSDVTLRFAPDWEAGGEAGILQGKGETTYTRTTTPARYGPLVFGGRASVVSERAMRFKVNGKWVSTHHINASQPIGPKVFGSGTIASDSRFASIIGKAFARQVIAAILQGSGEANVAA